MGDSLFADALKLKGEYFPDWEGIPDDIWHILLNEYFFKVCDSFGFQNVLETKDLFPHSLSFFSDWDLREVGLVEFENGILCRFELNQTCKTKLLEAEFADFDELYFFKKERLVGYYVNHDPMMGFVNYEPDIKLLFSIDESVTSYILESMRIDEAFKRYSQ